MKRIYKSIGILFLLITILFAGGVYGSVRNLDNYHKCSADVNDWANTEIIAVVLETCETEQLSTLTEEAQKECRAKAASSIAMAEVNTKKELRLNECKTEAEENFSNPFIKYPVTILRKSGILL